MRINAGELRNLVALQNYDETRSASGHPTRTYATYASIWAKFRTLSGTERMAAQQVSGIITHEVTIRYRTDVHVDHRILWGTRYFDIKDVRNVDEQNEQIRILVTEIEVAGPSSSSSPSASPSSSASA